MKVPGWVLARIRLGTPVTMVGSSAELFALFDSPPPEIVVVLVTVIAVVEMDTAIVIMGYEAPAASASDLLQLTFWPTTVQDQPVPAAVVGVMPDGRLSETVTAAAVDVFPELCAVNI